MVHESVGKVKGGERGRLIKLGGSLVRLNAYVYSC